MSKIIKYKVSNNSSSPITITGRNAFTIDGNCKDKPLSLPDNDNTKALIQRFRKNTPYVIFVLDEIESVNSANTEDTGKADSTKDNPPVDGNKEDGNKEDGEGETKSTNKVSQDVFASSCEVKKVKNEFIVSFAGKEYIIKTTKQEDAIVLAFEQYLAAE